MIQLKEPMNTGCSLLDNVSISKILHTQEAQDQEAEEAVDTRTLMRQQQVCRHPQCHTEARQEAATVMEVAPSRAEEVDLEAVEVAARADKVEEEELAHRMPPDLPTCVS